MIDEKNSATMHPNSRKIKILWAILFIGLVIAAYILFPQHQPYFRSALPFVFLLSCLGMHFFMHSGHGAGHGKK